MLDIICPELFCVYVYIYDDIYEHISMFINVFYSVG